MNAHSLVPGANRGGEGATAAPPPKPPSPVRTGGRRLRSFLSSPPRQDFSDVSAQTFPPRPPPGEQEPRHAHRAGAHTPPPPPTQRRPLGGGGRERERGPPPPLVFGLEPDNVFPRPSPRNKGNREFSQSAHCHVAHDRLTRVQRLLARRPAPLQPSTSVSAHLLRLNDCYCNQDLHHGPLRPTPLCGLRRAVPTSLYTLPSTLPPASFQGGIPSPSARAPPHPQRRGMGERGGTVAVHFGVISFRSQPLRRVSCYTLLSGFQPSWPPTGYHEQITSFGGSEMRARSGSGHALSDHPASPVLLTSGGPRGATRFVVLAIRSVRPLRTNKGGGAFPPDPPAPTGAWGVRGGPPHALAVAI